MRNFAEFYQVDGQPLYAPDAEQDLSFEDLDSADTGRDEAGYMHRFVVREKVGKWAFNYAQLTDDEYKYLLGLFAGKGTFQFTYPAPGTDDDLRTTEAYMSNYGIAWRDARQGIWRNMKFNIIEC